MAPKIEIIFKNENKPFFTGEKVEGYVKISTKKDVNCKALDINLNGIGYVNLKNVRKQSTTGDEDVSAQEKYYSFISHLMGEGSHSRKLTTGEHKFSFSFILPLNIPSSYESKHGYVRHSCKTVLTFPISFIPKEKCTVKLNVHNILDLNTLGWIARYPVTDHLEKDVKSLLGKSGKISLHLNIDRAAYVPQENIIINAQINNTASKQLSKAKAEIIQVANYKVMNHTFTKNKIISSNVKEYLPGKDHQWSAEILNIPEIPQSNLEWCNIITIEYFLRFQVISKSGIIQVEANIPITIGSLPFKETTKSETEASSSTRLPAISVDSFRNNNNIQEPIMPRAPAMQPSAPPMQLSEFPMQPSASSIYPDISPPTYEEAVSEWKS